MLKLEKSKKKKNFFLKPPFSNPSQLSQKKILNNEQKKQIFLR